MVAVSFVKICTKLHLRDTFKTLIFKLLSFNCVLLLSLEMSRIKKHAEISKTSRRNMHNIIMQYVVLIQDAPQHLENGFSAGPTLNYKSCDNQSGRDHQ